VTAAALEGDLRHFVPSEVFQFLQFSGATGRLELHRRGERAELFFEHGYPVLARTSGGSVRVGEVLVHRGAISKDALARGLEAQRARPNERLGAVLCAERLVTRDQVAHAVEEVLRRIVYGLMLWPEGRFRFVPGERVATDPLGIEIEFERMILDGLRHADELRGPREPAPGLEPR
jgi:hypothetical protein